MLKAVSSITNAIGALNYKGTWNASTNSPALASGVGTKGDYYVVSVAGNTTINGESLWGVGDWIVFNGTAWQKVDGGDTGNFSSVEVTGGNVSIKTAGQGIDFSANTHAAGMTNELLTWYEEGIVNAVLTDGVNDATMSSDSKMYYTRIGRMVFIQGYINTTALGSVSGPVLIKSLPFTVNGAQGAARSALAVGQAGGLAITASETVTGFATPGATTIDLRIWNATTGATQLTAAQFTASGFISFSIAYPV